MYKLIRSILFLLAAERAHHVTMGMLKVVCKLPGVKPFIARHYATQSPVLKREVFGLSFKNPVGLAAGFDKNASYMHELASLGFGFLEIGTITPKAQPGNPKPRLFRLQSDNALINRMGFNNEGLERAISKLKKRPEHIIVGGNIGKNKVTPNEEALNDYIICFKALYDHVDYFVVNVSSPNTPGLRELQEKEPLTELLQTLQNENHNRENPKPLLLKIAPDLTSEQLDDILDIVKTTKLDGLIATNTTISRDGLSAPEKRLEAIGAGGLSGKPLQERSTEIIKYIHSKNKSLPIIATGGIMDETSALEKIKAGASLVQLYTGFVYGGPGIIKRLNRAIKNHIEEA